MIKKKFEITGPQIFYYIMFLYCAYTSHINEETIKDVALIVVCSFCLIMAKLEGIQNNLTNNKE